MSIWDRIRTAITGLPPEFQEPSSTAPGDECLDPVQSLDANEKRIVVFVSSTFRDMIAERDELTTRIFPELRKTCEERGIAWGEVDLRWGIPPEKEQEEVLEICLRYIDKCRPYFIGMLGERYGWTGWTHAPALADEMPFLEKAQGRSVTELEILYGVLDDSEMKSRAFFYFRDPAYIETLPEDQRDDFREAPSSQEATKLSALKNRIRTSGMPVHDKYPDPVELGQLVRTDLLKVIDSLAPPPSATVTDEERAIAALDREAEAHDAFARSRFGVYVPRKEYFETLDDHAAGDGLPLVVTGDSGSGKSALLAHWTDRYRALHPKAVVIRHFVGATSDSADLTAMLRRFMGEFRRRLGVRGEIPTDDAALRAAFPNWLAMAAKKGRVVLAIDALNQLEDRHAALDLTWLPLTVPKNVRLVVSTLPGKPLDAIANRKWPALAVEPLTVDERKRVIRCYFRRFFRELSPDLVDRIAATPQAANPLFLRAVLEELRVHGTHEGLPDQVAAYLEIPTIPKLYEAILARYERDYERDRPGLVRDLCRFVWASRRGLSRYELRGLLRDPEDPLPDKYWAPLLLAMEHGLVEKGGVLTFFHDYLREAVKERYLSRAGDVTATHLHLATYFEGQPDGPRRLEELPWQLAAAGAWDRLVALLKDPVFFSTLFEAREYDLKQYWVKLEGVVIEEHRPYRMIDAYGPVIRDPATFPSSSLWPLRGLLYDTGHLDEAMAIGEHLIRTARGSEDQYTLQASLGNQALILKARGDLDGAMALLKEQERICRELGNVDSLQRSLGNQALILKARGDLDGAMALHKEEERICRELGNVDGLQASLGNQALILKARGDLDGAMALLKEQERICRDLGNVDGLSVSLGNQALILKARGDLDGAMALLKEQERICRDLGNVDGLSVSLGNQALILKARGDLDGAMALHKEEERICRELGNVEGLAISLANQAMILAQQARREEASRVLNEALALATRAGYTTLAEQIRGIRERQGL